MAAVMEFLTTTRLLKRQRPSTDKWFCVLLTMYYFDTSLDIVNWLPRVRYHHQDFVQGKWIIQLDRLETDFMVKDDVDLAQPPPVALVVDNDKVQQGIVANISLSRL